MASAPPKEDPKVAVALVAGMRLGFTFNPKMETAAETVRRWSISIDEYADITSPQLTRLVEAGFSFSSRQVGIVRSW